MDGADECVVFWVLRPWYKQTMFYHVRENLQRLQVIPLIPVFGTCRLQGKVELFLRKRCDRSAERVLMSRARHFYPEVTATQSLHFSTVF